MATRLTTVEREAELGRHLRDLRLRQNIDQRQLAERADVALNAVKRLEGGKGATVTSLVKVLRALGHEEWLETLAPQITVSSRPRPALRPPRRARCPGSRSRGCCLGCRR